MKRNLRRALPRSIRLFARLIRGPVDEVALVHFVMRAPPGFMVDVGAHFGESLEQFLEDGWQVLAFEPDPANRQLLTQRFAHRQGLRVDPRAASDRTAERVPFFSSDLSSGISTLTPFDHTHHRSGGVETVTLSNALQQFGVSDVDFLKVDAEGHDFFVLRGWPWQRVRPRAVVCEFEDRKTERLGYRMLDMHRLLRDQGYYILVSEWHPIVAYGRAHRWRRFLLEPEKVAADAWGNLIAMRSADDLHQLRRIAGFVSFING
jgi:FkbM family methyltransferase